MTNEQLNQIAKAAFERHCGRPHPWEGAQDWVLSAMRDAIACQAQQTARQTHKYVPHNRWPMQCSICGYGESEPLQHGEPRIDRPAKVGNARFGAGIKVSTVIAAAQRHYEHEVTQEKEAARIAAGDEMLKQFQQAVKDSEDAERYRWLRNESWAGYNIAKGKPEVATVSVTRDGAGNVKFILAEEAMDAAIDAARTAAKGEP